MFFRASTCNSCHPAVQVIPELQDKYGYLSSQEAVEASMMNTYFTDKRDTAGSLVPQLNMLNGDKWGKILTLVWTVNIFALMRLLQYIERLTQNLGSCTII